MSSLAVSHNEIVHNANEPRVIEGVDVTVCTNIYRDDCNIVVWKRDSATELKQQVDGFLKSNSNFRASMTTSPQNAFSSIHQTLGGSDLVSLLSEDIAELVDMFCCLFDLGRVGLRLTTLKRAMCPRFHVDHVPCRLVTTYQGAGTEWLPHQAIDRTKLGHGAEGKPDEFSGLFQSADDIRQLDGGDVALLKGERWEGNQNAGLVHRSPAILPGQNRLLLTLDLMSG